MTEEEKPQAEVPVVAPPTFPAPPMGPASSLPNGNPIMQFFKYAHLPAHLQEISKPFGEAAEWMTRVLPYNPEQSAGLRKLLEAKDCAVRARLFNK